jgi:hypothetical protein
LTKVARLITRAEKPPQNKSAALIIPRTLSLDFLVNPVPKSSQCISRPASPAPAASPAPPGAT